MAIVALIMAVAGLAIPVLLAVAALIMSVVAARRIGRSGGALRGKGLAVGAGITAGVVLLINAATIVLIASNWSDINRGANFLGDAVDVGSGIAEGRLVEWHKIKAGDCLRRTALEYSVVEPVGCDTPHHAEAFGIVRLSGDTYPGVGSLDVTVPRGCGDFYAGYVGGDRELNWVYLIPEEFEWNEGIRQGVCMIVPEEGVEEVTGSVRGSG